MLVGGGLLNGFRDTGVEIEDFESIGDWCYGDTFTCRSLDRARGSALWSKGPKALRGAEHETVEQNLQQGLEKVLWT